MRSRINKTIFILLWLLHFCEGARPYRVGWSSETYGPDGPWHALNISIGQPAQYVALVPWRQGPSLPLGRYNSCGPGGSPRCSWATSGLYKHKESSTSHLYKGPHAESFRKTHEVLIGPMVIEASSVYATDTLRFDPPHLSIPDVGLGVLYNSDVMSSSNNTFPNTMGGLSTGGPFARSQLIEYSELGDTIEYFGPETNVIHQYLYKQKQIPSPSWSMHIGSVAQNIPPSMVLGGYDPSRIVNSVLAQPIQAGIPLGVKITNIGIFNYSLEHDKSVPFAPGTESGNVYDFDQKLNTSFPIAINIQYPHMSLPMDTCKALTAHLPVIYRPHFNGIYIWDVKSPAYHELMSSTTYFKFTLEASRFVTPAPGAARSISVSVPIQLLDLVLDAPVSPVTPEHYFPCSHANLERGYPQGLGRAFLQAATIGYNWHTQSKATENEEGYWFLAQAPGPDMMKSSLQAILPEDNYIAGYPGSWPHTWVKYWTKVGTADSSGLSIGAQAGIGVGVGMGIIIIVAAVLIYLFMAKKSTKGSGLPIVADKGKEDDSESPPAEMEQTPRFQLHEMRGDREIRELFAQSSRPELPAEEPSELASPDTAVSKPDQDASLFSTYRTGEM